MLRTALGSCKGALVGTGVFSGLINLLMLTSSLFMLEVYDRVLPSRSAHALAQRRDVDLLYAAVAGETERVHCRRAQHDTRPHRPHARQRGVVSVDATARHDDTLRQNPLRSIGSGVRSGIAAAGADLDALA